jgi:hypothetical protein
VQSICSKGIEIKEDDTLKNIGKMTCIVLCIIGMIILPKSTYAADAGKNGGDIFLGSTYVDRSNYSITTSSMTESSMYGPLSPVYDFGDTRIDDYLSTYESGYIQTNHTNGPYNDFYNRYYTIISSLPGLPACIRQGVTIFNLLVTKVPELLHVNTDKSVEVWTRFSYRYFYEYLYAYDYNYRWKSEGQSVSKNYYQHYSIWYFNATMNEYEFASFNFSYTNNCPPVEINMAPNYKNYTALSNAAYYAWVFNNPYYERYPVGG